MFVELEYVLVADQLHSNWTFWITPLTTDAGALVQWLKRPAWKIRDRRFKPNSGPPSFKEKKKVLSRALVKIQYCGEPPRPIGSMLGLRLFKSCVLRAMSSHSSHHASSVGYPVLTQFSLYVPKGDLKTPKQSWNPSFADTLTCLQLSS